MFLRLCCCGLLRVFVSALWPHGAPNESKLNLAFGLRFGKDVGKWMDLRRELHAGFGCVEVCAVLFSSNEVSS